MSASNKYIIMCVGYTHSGKTTFARKLVKELTDIVLLDNDDIASFINSQYPTAVFSDYNKIKRNFKEPNLKFLLSKDILKFCLRAGLNIIHASGNLGKDARLVILNNAKKHNYKIITIYFNLPKELILSRIKITKKSKNCFKLSKSWAQVLKKQELYAELPPTKKNAIYYEIQNLEDYQRVFKELKKLLLTN